MLIFIPKSFLRKKKKGKEGLKRKIYKEDKREITQQLMDFFSSYLAVFKWISNVERRMALKKEKWRRNTDFLSISSILFLGYTQILPLTPV